MDTPKTPKVVEDNFYMVFVEGGNTPACKHTYPQFAHTEAKRLSELTGGKKAYVLRAVRCFQVISKEIEINSDDNLPF